MGQEIELLPPVAFDFMHNGYRYAGTYQMNIKHDFAKVIYSVHGSQKIADVHEFWLESYVVQGNKPFFSKMFHCET